MTDEIGPAEIRRWLERVEKKLDSLQVVHPDVYLADQRTAKVQNESLNKRVGAVEEGLETKADQKSLDDVRALALWAVGLLGAAVLSVLFYAIIQAATTR